MAQLISGNYKGHFGSLCYANENWFKGKGTLYLAVFTTYNDNINPDTPGKPKIIISIWDLMKKYGWEVEYFNKKLDKSVIWDGNPNDKNKPLYNGAFYF